MTAASALLLAACGDSADTTTTTTSSSVAPAEDPAVEGVDQGALEEVLEMVVVSVEDLPDGFVEEAPDPDDSNEFCGQSTLPPEEGQLAEFQRDFRNEATGISVLSAAEVFEGSDAASAGIAASEAILEACAGFEDEDGSSWSTEGLDISILDEADCCDDGFAIIVTIEAAAGSVTLQFGLAQIDDLVVAAVVTGDDADLVDSTLRTMLDNAA